MSYFRLSGVAALVIGLVLTFLLVWQFTDVYFVLDGQSDTPTDAQARRYVWTAALGLVSMASALLLATCASARGAIVASSIGLVLALIVAAVFAVPQDRWKPQPPVNELPDDYQPCYSGSNDCVGG